MCVRSHSSGQAQCVGWIRKWAGRHVALCHSGPRVPITDGPLTLAQAWGQIRHHMERKRQRVSWHSQPERMNRQHCETLRWKTRRDSCSGEAAFGNSANRRCLRTARKKGGFIPGNHRWDHLSLLAWINHIPGPFHAGKSVCHDPDSHKSNSRCRSFPGTDLTFNSVYLLVFITQA